jgi:hypothetical protein
MPLAESTTEIVMEKAPAGARLMPEDLVRLPPVDSWRLERSFSQRSRLEGQSRSLTLFNGHFLELSECKGRHQRRAVFNLAFLEAEPEVHRFIAWRWIGLGVASLGVGTLAMASGLLLAGSGLLALAILTGLQAVRRSRYQWVYFTHLGRTPLFVLEPGWVFRNDAEAFAGLLGERIEGARWLLPRGRDQLAAIMAEHRRLHESGCLSTRRYERAKRRILAAFSRADRHPGSR